MQTIQLMTIEYATTIFGWSYENEYSIYSLEQDGDTLDELLNGEYFARLGEEGTPLGFYCFGESARIPMVEEDVYVPGYLDFGLGMRPDLCGKGKGLAFVMDGLDFAGKRYGAASFRLTVAAFNARAIRVYEKAGFQIVRTVRHRGTGDAFYIMTHTR